MENQALIEQALLAREKSISPYSHFSVGAALLCKNGSVYLGANIENSAYPVCICAERVAFFRALMDGQRDFVGQLTGFEKDEITLLLDGEVEMKVPLAETAYVKLYEDYDDMGGLDE